MQNKIIKNRQIITQLNKAPTERNHSYQRISLNILQIISKILKIREQEFLPAIQLQSIYLYNRPTARK